MPAPTDEDYWALSYLEVPNRIEVRYGGIYYTGEQGDEARAKYDPGKPVALRVLNELHKRKADRDRMVNPVQSPAPIFDELWELKGEEATYGDMVELMAGGRRAEIARQEMLADKGVHTEARLDILSARIKNIETLLEKLVRQGAQQALAGSTTSAAVTSQAINPDR